MVKSKLMGFGKLTIVIIILLVRIYHLPSHMHVIRAQRSLLILRNPRVRHAKNQNALSGRTVRSWSGVKRTHPIAFAEPHELEAL